MGETPVERSCKDRKRLKRLLKIMKLPPPNPTQETQQDFIIEAQQDLIIETQQDPKELPESCKITPQKISFNQVVFKKLKENSTASLEAF